MEINKEKPAWNPFRAENNPHFGEAGSPAHPVQNFTLIPLRVFSISLRLLKFREKFKQVIDGVYFAVNILSMFTQ